MADRQMKMAASLTRDIKSQVVKLSFDSQRKLVQVKCVANYSQFISLLQLRINSFNNNNNNNNGRNGSLDITLTEQFLHFTVSEGKQHHDHDSCQLLCGRRLPRPTSTYTGRGRGRA